MAMALQTRTRTPAGRHSHRNRPRRFLLSDHDLRGHLYRPVACHLVYPPLVVASCFPRIYLGHASAKRHDVGVPSFWRHAFVRKLLDRRLVL